MCGSPLVAKIAAGAPVSGPASSAGPTGNSAPPRPASAAVQPVSGQTPTQSGAPSVTRQGPVASATAERLAPLSTAPGSVAPSRAAPTLAAPSERQYDRGSSITGP